MSNANAPNRGPELPESGSQSNPKPAADSDFKSLHGDTRFEALLAKGKSAAAPGAEPK